MREQRRETTATGVLMGTVLGGALCLILFGVTGHVMSLLVLVGGMVIGFLLGARADRT